MNVENKKEENIAKRILDKWATAVIPKDAIFVKNGKAGVNQNKTRHYGEHGYKGDEVLWIAPKDCIRIEFEDTPDNNHRYILELESVAKSLGFDYCITGHGGKSDYFNIFKLKGIPFNDDNKIAKMLLIDMLLPEMAKDKLDRTNLGWTPTPVIGHPHWKPKYNGAIHRILRGKNPLEHNNEYPKELLKKIEKLKKLNKQSALKWKQTDSWVEDFLLNYCLNNKLPEGERHMIIEKNLAALIIFKKDKELIKKRWRKIQNIREDGILGWEKAILQGKYTSVSAGELVNYIKRNNINYIIPKKEEKTESKENKKINFPSGILKITNYVHNVEFFYEQQPFFYDKTGIFWFWSWKKSKWVMVDEVDVMNAIDDVLQFGGDTVTSSVKSNYLEAFKRVGRKKMPKETPKHWIQFKNKIFDLKTKEIFGATPEYFNCNPIPWDIGESSETPVIDKLFEEWVGKDYVKTLKEIIAYCCLPDYPIHMIFCFIGTGSNGKTKFQQLLSRFIGKDNICSTELDSLLNSRFETAKLYKKLVCQMGETNFGTINKTSLLKKLTGQDLIGFEFKQKKPFDDYSYAKILINSNSLPSSEDTSEGFYRRWLIIDFPNQFPEGKDILEIIPKQEYNNLARQVLKILPRLLEIGTFTNQGSIDERRHRYIMASNPLSLFIDNFCVHYPDRYIRYSELYTAYVQFLKIMKRRIISKKEFSKALELEGYEIKRTSKRYNDSWITDRFIEGIDLKSNFMTLMTDMTQLSLNFPICKIKWKFCDESHKSHNGNTSPETPKFGTLTSVSNGDNATIIRTTKQKEDNFVTIEEPIATGKSILENIGLEDYVEFVRERKEYPIIEFVEKYGKKILNELLKKGYLVEMPKGILKVLE